MSDPAWETRQLLFIYGTLLAPTGHSAVDAAVASGLSLGPAYMHGRLYDLGDYPGVQPVREGGTWPADALARADRESAPRVFGRLLAFSDPDAALAVLDGYEGADPASPYAGEFTRANTDVVLSESGRTVKAQVYLYALSIAGKAPIPSGDYMAYLRGRQGSET